MIKSYLIVVVTYACALAGAIYFLKLQGSINDVLVKTLMADVIATVIVFCFSVIFKNASLYDPYWSVAPPIILIYWNLKVAATGNATIELYAAVIIFWSIRLTYNWFKGWQGIKHEDWRYQLLRANNPSIYPIVNLTGIHLFPTLMVFAGMLPVYYSFRGNISE